ncbi:MAG: MarR family winged helix-turn-helix transcriptional regulator [Aggregatilineaceae bacterium]
MTEECAGAVMDTVPLIMRLIRAEMRSHRSPDLSVPQFRALLYVYRRAGASLSDVAEHLGLTLPSTSKLVNRLVERGLLTRASAPDDRRRMILNITPTGQIVLDAAAQATRARLMEQLATLSAEECETVIAAMRLLQRVFTLEAATDSPER